MACLPKVHKRISRYASAKRGKLSDKTRRIHELWDRDRMDLIDLVEIGALLAYHKHKVGHRKWLEWVEKQIPFSDRTARAYMLLFRAYGDGYDHGYEDADLLLESYGLQS
jgi:hypothetical protein